jgi:hypothetical protein
MIFIKIFGSPLILEIENILILVSSNAHGLKLALIGKNIIQSIKIKLALQIKYSKISLP